MKTTNPIDANLRDRIQRHHGSDLALYRWAVQRRETAGASV